MTTTGRPLRFLGLVAVVSVPFFVLGAFGGVPRVGAMQLPVSAVMFVVPVTVAAVLTWLESGRPAVGALLLRSLPRRGDALRWNVLAVGLIAAITVLSYLLLRWAGYHESMPPLSLLAAPAVIVVFLLAAACEELGWTGYATDPLQQRWGSVVTAVGLGVYWAVWHLVPLLQIGHDNWWIAGWFTTTVAVRVLIIWLYNHTDRVYTAILLHTTVNVTDAYTPGLDRAATALTTGALTAVVAIAVTTWPLRTRVARA
ncbi:type II CAAX endopeptidase family protein [Nocardia sp. NPDC006630]|uniref:CPBP family intramembrane glutamic endopeptidase n=1 Tax=Nocardia sp. NPDC006630 TaxID=3157181 RepID=UPI0033A2B83F